MKHKDPGAAPKTRPKTKDPELEGRLQQAGSGDTAAWERSMETSRAQYRSAAGRGAAEPETEEQRRAREYEYGTARFAQPTPEALAAHAKQKESHVEEVRETAREQEQFEKHGMRTINPLREQIVVGGKKAGPTKISLAPTGHQQVMASIQRKRALQSAVPAQVEKEQEPDSPKVHRATWGQWSVVSSPNPCRRLWCYRAILIPRRSAATRHPCTDHIRQSGQRKAGQCYTPPRKLWDRSLDPNP